MIKFNRALLMMMIFFFMTFGIVGCGGQEWSEWYKAKNTDIEDNVVWLPHPGNHDGLTGRVEVKYRNMEGKWKTISKNCAGSLTCTIELPKSQSQYSVEFRFEKGEWSEGNYFDADTVDFTD